MPNYLVERYLPATGVADIDAAVAGISASDGRVRHLRATFVPEDETCFHVVEAPSLEAIRDALKRAAITYERIVEAVERPQSHTPRRAYGGSGREVRGPDGESEGFPR